MRNHLFTGAIIALVLFLGGLFVMANGTTPPAPKTMPEVKKPTAAAAKDAEAKAKKALTEAFTKQSKTKGYHFSGTKENYYVDMNMTSPSEFTGVKNNPDNVLYMLLTAKVMGREKKTELYQKGDLKYAAVMGTGDRADATTYCPLVQADYLCACLKDYKFNAEEKLNDHDQVVIEAGINDAGVGELLSQLPEMGLLPATAVTKTTAASFKVWVDKKTGLMSRISFSIDVAAGMAGQDAPEEGSDAPKNGRKITALIDFADYDKDVAIKVPDEAKAVLNAKVEPAKKK